MVYYPTSIAGSSFIDKVVFKESDAHNGFVYF